MVGGWGGGGGCGGRSTCLDGERQGVLFASIVKISFA